MIREGYYKAYLNSVLQKQKQGTQHRQSNIDELTDDFSNKAKINEATENSSDDNFNENVDLDLADPPNFESTEIPFTINNRSNSSSPQRPPIQKPQPTYNPLSNRTTNPAFQPFGFVSNNGFQNNPFNNVNNMIPSMQTPQNMTNITNLQNLNSIQMGNIQGVNMQGKNSF